MKRYCPHVVPYLSFVLVLACMLNVRSVAQSSADWDSKGPLGQRLQQRNRCVLRQAISALPHVGVAVS